MRRPLAFSSSSVSNLRGPLRFRVGHQGLAGLVPHGQRPDQIEADGHELLWRQLAAPTRHPVDDLPDAGLCPIANLVHREVHALVQSPSVYPLLAGVPALDGGAGSAAPGPWP